MCGISAIWSASCDCRSGIDRSGRVPAIAGQTRTPTSACRDARSATLG